MARREKNLSCLLLQLLMRLSVASEEAGDAGGALEFSLSPGQHRSLASILELTQEGGDDSEEGCDSITLVRDADQAFTREASEGDRGSMWSVDEGLDADGVAELRRRVATRLKAEDGGACGDRGGELRLRAALALANTCLVGRSANFKVEESVADQFLSLMGPYVYVGVGSVLVLALGGALAFFDAFVVSRLLGPKGRKRVPCACPICEKKLELREKIGEGGFGSVWRCGSPRGVVLKLVRVDLEHDVNTLKNVLDEARHLQELRHEHIVAYYDTFVHRDAAGLFRDEDASDGDAASWWPWSDGQRAGDVADFAVLAMEDCAGGSLLDHVASGVPFPLSAVVEVTRQCATALAYAHANGIVHRDIKLENVFVKLDGKGRGAKAKATIKIGDFGLAVRDLGAAPAARPGHHHYHAFGERPASSGEIGGTEVYQPPECFAAPVSFDDDAAWGDDDSDFGGGGTPSPPPSPARIGAPSPPPSPHGADDGDAPAVSGAAVDAWGLGCVLYEMATSCSLPNEPPFLGMLLLEADADRHTAAILDRFASALDTAEEAAAQDRADTARRRVARTDAVRGLVDLCAELFSVDAALRPSLGDVASRPFLAHDPNFKLEDFFKFTYFDPASPKGHRTTVSKRSRMLRAKSLPKGGRHGDSPVPGRKVHPADSPAHKPGTRCVTPTAIAAQHRRTRSVAGLL